MIGATREIEKMLKQMSTTSPAEVNQLDLPKFVNSGIRAEFEKVVYIII